MSARAFTSGGSRRRKAPWERKPAVRKPRPWRGPVDKRQTRLAPPEVFFQLDILRTMVGSPPPASSGVRSRKPPATRAPLQANLLRPWELVPRVPRRAAGKGKSMGTGGLTRAERSEAKKIRLRVLPEHPLTRAGCVDVPRPCPFVSCERHLYLDVNPNTGAIKINFPGLERVDHQQVDAGMRRLAPRVMVQQRGLQFVSLLKVDGVELRSRGSTAESARGKTLAKLRAHLEADATYLDLDSMEETCADDVAEQGEQSAERVGRLMNLTPQGIQQIESSAAKDIAAKTGEEDLIAIRVSLAMLGRA